MASDVTDQILQKISDGFQLLADLHTALDGTEAAAEAQAHVTNATRELAAVQRIFDRRTTR